MDTAQGLAGIFPAKHKGLSQGFVLMVMAGVDIVQGRF
jgi:hypothetical protein